MKELNIRKEAVIDLVILQMATKIPTKPTKMLAVLLQATAYYENVVSNSPWKASRAMNEQLEEQRVALESLCGQINTVSLMKSISPDLRVNQKSLYEFLK